MVTTEKRSIEEIRERGNALVRELDPARLAEKPELVERLIDRLRDVVDDALAEGRRT